MENEWDVAMETDGQVLPENVDIQAPSEYASWYGGGA